MSIPAFHEVHRVRARRDNGAMTEANASARPRLVRTRAELAAALAQLPGTRGLVMTMGALHEGHLSLVERARGLADHVVVTIFVNPTQFAPGEDYDAYPRTLEADMAALATVGADLVWAPEPEEVYPTPPRLTIDPGPVAHVLEGVTRPTHFAGVALIVTKVLGLTRPDVALFGEKDAQQLAVLRTVVRELDVPVRIVGAPIVRAEDGVALSSRNQYLSEDERVRARSLRRALLAGTEAAPALDARGVVAAARAVLDAEDGVEVDYVALVDEDSFDLLALSTGTEPGVRPLAEPSGPRVRLLLAARVGTTRLIDNEALDLTGVVR